MIPLTRLRAEDIQSAHAAALFHGLSGRSVVQHHRVLSRALRVAVGLRKINANPCQWVELPAVKNVEAEYLDQPAVRRFLDEAQRAGWPYPTVMALDVATGLRRSEILALDWRHVDLTAGRLQVVRGLHRIPGREPYFEEPKNKKRRAVTLSRNTLLSLRRHREQQEAIHAELGTPFDADTLVFCNAATGAPLSPSTVSKVFKRIANKVGLPNAHFHSLRHSHASLLLLSGQHLKVVQERLGHSSIAITGDLYSHVADSLQDDAAAAFDEVMSRESVPTGER